MSIQTFQNSDFEKPDFRKNRIAEGGFAGVYRLHKVKGKHDENTLYAVKIPHETDFELFKDEIRAISQLNYKTIIHLHGITLDDPPYIITDYLPNGTVKDYILGASKVKDDSLFDNLAYKMILLLGIAMGMKYLHSKDIAHRDLKPENVLLDSNHYPVITDFGLSKMNSGSASHTYKSATGLIGTPAYMSPELLNPLSTEISTKKADIYAFGITMYAILYAKVPFEEEIMVDPNYISFPQKIIDGLRPKLDDDLVSPAINALIKKCWDGNPNARPDFQEICSDLLIEKDEMVKREEIDEEGITKINNFLIFCNDNVERPQNTTLSRKDKQKGIELNKRGDAYLNGDGVEQNYSKALLYYRQASFYENVDAYYNIGFCYENGYSVDQDYIKAMEYYQKAVDKGNIEALNKIGTISQKGYGVKKDYGKAIEYYQKAADQGNSNRLNLIGYLYEKGLG